MNDSKLIRTTFDYGNGATRVIFDGELFMVVHWIHECDRSRTVIKYKFKVDGKPDVGDISFDGYVNFKSDDECLEQYEAFEIKQMFEIQHELGKLAGISEKTNEVVDAQGMYVAGDDWDPNEYWDGILHPK